MAEVVNNLQNNNFQNTNFLPCKSFSKQARLEKVAEVVNNLQNNNLQNTNLLPCKSFTKQARLEKVAEDARREAGLQPGLGARHPMPWRQQVFFCYFLLFCTYLFLLHFL